MEMDCFETKSQFSSVGSKSPLKDNENGTGALTRWDERSLCRKSNKCLLIRINTRYSNKIASQKLLNFSINLYFTCLLILSKKFHFR